MPHALFMFITSTVLPTVLTEISGVTYYAWAGTFFAVCSIVGAAITLPVIAKLTPRRAYVFSALLFMACSSSVRHGVEHGYVHNWTCAAGLGSRPDVCDGFCNDPSHFSRHASVRCGRADLQCVGSRRADRSIVRRGNCGRRTLANCLLDLSSHWYFPRDAGLHCIADTIPAIDTEGGFLKSAGSAVDAGDNGSVSPQWCSWSIIGLQRRSRWCARLPLYRYPAGRARHPAKFSCAVGSISERRVLLLTQWYFSY